MKNSLTHPEKLASFPTRGYLTDLCKQTRAGKPISAMQLARLIAAIDSIIRAKGLLERVGDAALRTMQRHERAIIRALPAGKDGEIDSVTIAKRLTKELREAKRLLARKDKGVASGTFLGKKVVLVAKNPPAKQPLKRSAKGRGVKTRGSDAGADLLQ